MCDMLHCMNTTRLYYVTTGFYEMPRLFMVYTVVQTQIETHMFHMCYTVALHSLVGLEVNNNCRTLYVVVSAIDLAISQWLCYSSVSVDVACVF